MNISGNYSKAFYIIFFNKCVVVVVVVYLFKRGQCILQKIPEIAMKAISSVVPVNDVNV